MSDFLFKKLREEWRVPIPPGCYYFFWTVLFYWASDVEISFEIVWFDCIIYASGGYKPCRQYWNVCRMKTVLF